MAAFVLIIKMNNCNPDAAVYLMQHYVTWRNASLIA